MNMTEIEEDRNVKRKHKNLPKISGGREINSTSNFFFYFQTLVRS